MFTLLTLVLAASGVFAVISQSVAQRTREFGIRLAIGATPGALLRSVMAREARLIAAAIGTGLVFTMALTRVLFVELTSLSAIVPSMWIGALMAASIAAASAALLAIWRIVRLEPSVVFRRT
jgi:ABC-type antimicrobial peptide transport system permease subunit